MIDWMHVFEQLPLDIFEEVEKLVTTLQEDITTAQAQYEDLKKRKIWARAETSALYVTTLQNKLHSVLTEQVVAWLVQELAVLKKDVFRLSLEGKDVP